MLQRRLLLQQQQPTATTVQKQWLNTWTTSRHFYLHFTSNFWIHYYSKLFPTYKFLFWQKVYWLKIDLKMLMKVDEWYDVVCVTVSYFLQYKIFVTSQFVFMLTFINSLIIRLKLSYQNHSWDEILTDNIICFNQAIIWKWYRGMTVLCFDLANVCLTILWLHLNNLLKKENDITKK